jgi:hypothetical protein
MTPFTSTPGQKQVSLQYAVSVHTGAIFHSAKPHFLPRRVKRQPTPLMKQ